MAAMSVSQGAGGKRLYTEIAAKALGNEGVDETPQPEVHLLAPIEALVCARRSGGCAKNLGRRANAIRFRSGANRKGWRAVHRNGADMAADAHAILSAVNRNEIAAEFRTKRARIWIGGARLGAHGRQRDQNRQGANARREPTRYPYDHRAKPSIHWSPALDHFGTNALRSSIRVASKCAGPAGALRRRTRLDANIVAGSCHARSRSAPIPKPRLSER